MARPKKATVDYFPHMTEHGKTIFILESKWGNDGYAVWFKMLEKLGSTNGHFIDCREETALLYLSAYTRVSQEILIEIINTLAYLHAIDRDLWRHKLIYCQHFVDNVVDAYRRRKDDLPSKEKVIAVTNMVIADINEVNAVRSTERERERERESKEDKVKRFVPPSVSEVETYMKEINFNGDAQRFVDHYTANGWRVGKNPMKNWQAAVRTWRGKDNEHKQPGLLQPPIDEKPAYLKGLR